MTLVPEHRQSAQKCSLLSQSDFNRHAELSIFKSNLDCKTLMVDLFIYEKAVAIGHQ